MDETKRLAIGPDSTDAEIAYEVEAWIAEHVPEPWQAAAPGGRQAIRAVRPRSVRPGCPKTGWRHSIWAASIGKVHQGTLNQAIR